MSLITQFMDFFGGGYDTPDTNPVATQGGTIYDGAGQTGPVYGPQPAPTGYYDSSQPSPAPTNTDPTNTYIAPTNNDPAPAPSGDEGPSLNEQLRNQVFAELDKTSGLIDESGQSAQLATNTQYDTSSEQINRYGDTAGGQLDVLGDENLANKTKTIRDISGDFQNALRAGQIFLGGIGAGSSSAVGRLSGALAKGANRRTTDVTNQFAGNASDISLKRVDVENLVQDQLGELETWKADKLAGITQWVNQQKIALQGQRASVQQQYGEQIMQAALGQLGQLNQQAQSYGNAIAEWGLARANTTQQAGQAIQNASQYNLGGLKYSPFSTGVYSNQYAPQTARIGGSGGTEEELRNQLG